MVPQAANGDDNPITDPSKCRAIAAAGCSDALHAPRQDPSWIESRALLCTDGGSMVVAQQRWIRNVTLEGANHAYKCISYHQIHSNQNPKTRENRPLAICQPRNVHFMSRSKATHIHQFVDHLPAQELLTMWHPQFQCICSRYFPEVCFLFSHRSIHQLDIWGC